MFQGLKQWIGQRILRYLSTPSGRYAPFFAPPLDVLRQSLQPGDILLIEGNTRLSAVIKYLTQSTWSHAALYIGDALGPPKAGEEPKVFIDAEAEPGVRAIPLSEFAHFNTRICRPVGLSDAERKKVVDFAVSK